MSRCWLGLLLVLGCRFGGPSGAPEILGPDAGPAVDAPADFAFDAATDASTTFDVTAAAPDAGCNAPFAVAGCDPVCNIGCSTLSRCDVGTEPRTGACVGIWITGEGQACFKGSGTDACAAKLTCVSGTCRRLCYRDGDCQQGACCRTPVEVGGMPSGFLTCGPC